MDDKKYQDILDDTQGLLQVHWEWKKWLYKLENEIKPETYIEIGNEYGAALATINKLLPQCRLIGVDIKPPRETDSNPVTPPDKHEHHYEFIRGNSHDLETWRQVWIKLRGERADVLFIDGAHYFDDVYKDWMDYGRMARVVAFHDIVDSKYARRGGFYVHYLWEYLKTQYRWEEIVAPKPEDKDADTWGGIGIIYLKDKLGNHPLPSDIHE